MKRKLFLTFPQRIVGDPLLQNLKQDFGVEWNIKAASITGEFGLMALEIDGEEAAIDRAVAFFREKGVTVEVLLPGSDPRL